MQKGKLTIEMGSLLVHAFRKNLEVMKWDGRIDDYFISTGFLSKTVIIKANVDVLEAIKRTLNKIVGKK